MNTLLSLSIENYRSFCVEQTLRLDEGRESVVTSLYGPNAGGKSNIAKALALVKRCIKNSANASWHLPYEPFAFRTGMSEKPSKFIVEFFSEECLFRYSLAFDREKVTWEKLECRERHRVKMTTIFDRDENGITNQSTAQKKGFGKKLVGKTRPDTLLITKGREDNNTYSNRVFDFFDNILFDFPSPMNDNEPIYMEMLEESQTLREQTMELIGKCDFAIRNIQVKQVPIPSEFLEAPFFSEEFKEQFAGTEMNTSKTVHALRNEEGTIVGQTDLDFNDESMGTQAFFQCAVPALKVLNDGGLLYLDEFGAYMHPVLAVMLLDLFRGDRNKKQAQLILNTHNTSLMKSLERDQIFFVEKTIGEESRIIPMKERGARADESFEKRYFQGLYGALPFIERM